MDDMKELGIVIRDSKIVVSSRDVARVFEKEHKDVLKSIRELGVNDEFAQRNFAPGSYKDANNQDRPEYLITRDGFTILAMGYTGDRAMAFKIAYIRAFNAMEEELRNKTALAAPRTLLEALRMAADLEEKRLLILAENETMKPKADFFDAVADSKTAVEMACVAKVLGIPGIGRNNLFKILRERKILLPNNQPYQEYIDRGYFRVIEQKYQTADGETRISVKTLAFQKGIDFIRKTLTGTGDRECVTTLLGAGLE